MAAGPSVDEIITAIAESGYLMEQEVATQLEKRGLHVRTNVAFEDPDEGKSREMDVTAVQRVAFNQPAKLMGFVELLVECKNSANPFVFIARPKNDADRRRSPGEFCFPYEYQMAKITDGTIGLRRQVSAFQHLGFDKVYQTHVNAWKAVQFCRIDRNGKGWHANHGGLYDAIFYPMAKALAAKRRELPTPSRSNEWRYLVLFFPLVVTSGDLFLIDSTADIPTPVAVDHVSFEREIKSGKLAGSFTVTFVRQEALETYLRDVVDPLAALTVDLIEKRHAFLSDTDLPWCD